MSYHYCVHVPIMLQFSHPVTCSEELGIYETTCDTFHNFGASDTIFANLQFFKVNLTEMHVYFHIICLGVTQHLTKTYQNVIFMLLAIYQQYSRENKCPAPTSLISQSPTSIPDLFTPNLSPCKPPPPPPRAPPLSKSGPNHKMSKTFNFCS